MTISTRQVADNYQTVTVEQNGVKFDSEMLGQKEATDLAKSLLDGAYDILRRAGRSEVELSGLCDLLEVLK